MGLHIPVLLGSVRQDRIGIRAANFVMAELRKRGHEPVLVDAMQLDLPLLDRMYKEHPKGQAPAKLESLAQLYRQADGFMIVAGEYNNGIQPALKNMLDYFLEEYFFRPSAILCYSSGRFGGVRAAMQLRMTLAELGMSSIPSILPIGGLQNAIAEDGTVLHQAAVQAAPKFLDEFEWYAKALGHAREAGVPY